MDETKKEEIQKLLLEYIKKKDPRMLVCDPKFLEIKEGRVHFGAKKHYGVLTFPMEKLFKK